MHPPIYATPIALGAICLTALFPTAAAEPTPAPPLAVLIAPATAQVGQICLLQTTGSHGATHKWRTWPAAGDFTLIPIRIDTPDQEPAALLILSKPATVTIAWIELAAADADVAIATINSGTTPPPPPTPSVKSAAIVEHPTATPLATRQLLARPEWRTAATAAVDFLGVIPDDVIDRRTGQPPAALVPFLNAAKGLPLPRLIMCDAGGIAIFNAPVPATLDALIALFPKPTR
jgi:hypothetical protein